MVLATWFTVAGLYCLAKVIAADSVCDILWYAMIATVMFLGGAACIARC